MSQKALKIFITTILFLVLAGGFFVLSGKEVSAAAGINKQINFQGKVVNTDGTNVADGNYNFTFSIYTVASGGANIWTETKSLAVIDGIFQTNLGSSTALPGSVDFNSDNIYLGINFNANGEMSPRVQFTATPYSFNTDKLDGFDWASPGAIGSVAASSGVFTSLSSSGNTALASAAGSTLSLGNTTGGLTINSGGTSSLTNTAGGLTISTATSGILALNSAGALNFSSSSASTFNLPSVANALNFDSNTLSIDALNNRIGIGTNAPAASFHNAGSTVFGSQAVANLAIGGAIGAAAATVDAYTTFNVSQTTAGQTITLPSPSNTAAGRIAFVNDTGTTSFYFYGTQIIPGNSRQAIWNGDSWTLTGNADDDNNKTIRKTEAQSVTSSTALQSDNHLTFSMGANEVWFFQISGVVTNSGTTGMKAAMLSPAGSTCSLSFSDGYNASNATSAVCGATPTAAALTTTQMHNTTDQFYLTGTITNGATAGSATFQWAQNTSRTTALTMQQNSSVTVYRISGADLAEVYYSNDPSVVSGNVVSIDGSGASQVKKAVFGDEKAIGIVSTKPGLVMGDADGSGKPVMVGLGGRVPVRVSDEGGPIEPGDYITASSMPGIGMKAAKAGNVVAQALTRFDGSGDGIVIAFIKNTYFDGEDTVDDNGNNLSGGALLQKLIDSKSGNQGNQSLSKISTDMIAAGLEIVTPQLTAENIIAKSIKADHIEGLEIMQTGIDDAQNSSSENADAVKSLGQEIKDMQKIVKSLSSRSSNFIASNLIELGDNVMFKPVVEFMDKAVFHKDVEFSGQVIFSQNSAGYALIRSGQDKVHVVFENAYANVPVVNASISLQQIDDDEVRKASEDLLLLSGTRFIITDVTEKGFDIRIDQKADADTPFSWQAISVKNAKTYQGGGRTKNDKDIAIDEKNDPAKADGTPATGNPSVTAIHPSEPVVENPAGEIDGSSTVSKTDGSQAVK